MAETNDDADCGCVGDLTAVKRVKFAKNKENAPKERLSLLLFKVRYFTSILLIY